MPLYEYKCEQCGRVNEVIQKFSDEPLTACEVCQGAVHRLMSAPALQFKGTGWYITDYAKGNKSGSSSSNSDSKSGNNSGNGDSSKKSDSKSDSSKSDSAGSSKPAATTTTSSSSDKK